MTRQFNLTLFRPDHPRFRIMDSHLEVMHSLQWGFQALGMDCTMHINQIDPQRTNIVFGWIIGAQMGALAQLPPDSILYNFEQFSERDIASTAMATLAQRFQIWDYSAVNLPRWQACNPLHQPYHAPVSFAPNLVRVPVAAEPDIDMLYVGSVSAGRAARLAELSGHVSRPAVVSMQNVWGTVRDGFMGRSRLMLNIGDGNPALRIFEIVRVSYYLANGLAVVCEDVPGQHIEDDMREALLRVPRERLPDTCTSLLQTPDLRAQWALRGRDAFMQRDVRTVLRQFFL